MSDTPRTDLEEATQTQRFGVYMVKSDFARTLERENAAMREAIRVAHEAGRACEDTLEEAGWPDCAQRLSDSLSKLRPFLKP